MTANKILVYFLLICLKNSFVTNVHPDVINANEYQQI
jgi:hypothetical protein